MIAQVKISIHTPHAGSDFERVPHKYADIRFQSTLPMRGATVIQQLAPIISQISIHTPHAGSDLTDRRQAQQGHISIHTPHAGSDIASTSIF